MFEDLWSMYFVHFSIWWQLKCWQLICDAYIPQLHQNSEKQVGQNSQQMKQPVCSHQAPWVEFDLSNLITSVTHVTRESRVFVNKTARVSQFWPIKMKWYHNHRPCQLHFQKSYGGRVNMMSLNFDWPKLRSRFLKHGYDWIQIAEGERTLGTAYACY